MIRENFFGNRVARHQPVDDSGTRDRGCFVALLVSAFIYATRASAAATSGARKAGRKVHAAFSAKGTWDEEDQHVEISAKRGVGCHLDAEVFVHTDFVSRGQCLCGLNNERHLNP